MAAKRKTQRTETVLTVEVHGGLSKEELHGLVDEFEESGTISGITVELPTDLSIEALSHLSTELGQPQIDMDSTGKTSKKESEEAETTQPDDEGASAEGGEGNRSTWLQIDGTPYKAMRILDAHDSWLLTAEIRKAVPEEWDVNRDTLGSTLSNLADRGLVKKRSYEEDKRQTEYRITALGRDAVEAARDRAEEQDETDDDALSDDKLVTAAS